MSSQVVSPIDIQVPESEDFVSAFGCDYVIDEDCNQQYHFQDDHEAKVKLTFGLVDNSFGLSLWQGDSEVVRIYDEFLLGASIDEAHQSVTVVLKKGGVTEKISLTIWPKFVLSVQAMR